MAEPSIVRRSFKQHGRRTPYTEIGIARVPCVRCGRKPSHHQFQLCADARLYRPLCIECDIELNRIVLQFFNLPNWERMFETYRALALNEPTPRK